MIMMITMFIMMIMMFTMIFLILAQGQNKVQDDINDDDELDIDLGSKTCPSFWRTRAASQAPWRRSPPSPSPSSSASSPSPLSRSQKPWQWSSQSENQHDHDHGDPKQVSLKTEIIKQKQEMINCLQDELIKVMTVMIMIMLMMTKLVLNDDDQ